MRRRKLLTALGGTAVCVSLDARAQQPRVPHIGVLVPGNPEPVRTLVVTALRDVGYIDGKTARVTFRSAEGRPALLPELASDLVRLKVDIIVTHQTPAATAAKRATREIPVVMAGVADPVGTGLVASLARPGGNLTGFSGATTEVSAKILEIVHDALPAARHIVVLANAADPFARPFVSQATLAAKSMGIEMRPIMIHHAHEIDAAFAQMRRDGVDAVVIQPSLPRRRAIELAQEFRLPSVSPSREFAEEGGLLSYAASYAELCRGAAGYVDRILKGARPADLPIVLASRFDLVINLRTARALGLTIPPSILARADEVIE